MACLFVDPSRSATSALLCFHCAPRSGRGTRNFKLSEQVVDLLVTRSAGVRPATITPWSLCSHGLIEFGFRKMAVSVWKREGARSKQNGPALEQERSAAADAQCCGGNILLAHRPHPSLDSREVLVVRHGGHAACWRGPRPDRLAGERDQASRPSVRHPIQQYVPSHRWIGEPVQAG